MMVRQHDPGGVREGLSPTATGAVGDSFEEFYAANFQALTLQLYAYTADVGQAQDAVQEAFSRAWARWDRLVRYERPAAWVRTVAMNVVRNRWRRLRAARTHARYHQDQTVEGPGPDRVALARALASLPETQRRAVVLFHVADLSIADIAEQEGVAPGTVKSWLHRGRAALAAELSEPRTEDPHV
ncbi:SigE family RNA polymerase sigma factor [Micromonospora sp. NPDC047670]|uniref:SigE family RNA polymerase sigma factor n=1 Tax=Micromonospora sp. NPDC047670 TaxID=3364252 RepID=UPI00371DD7B4